MPRAGQIIRALDFAGYASVLNTNAESGVTSTSFITGTSVCGVTFVAPTSGQVKISWAARIEVNTSTVRGLVSIEVRDGGTVGSGTVIAAASALSALEIGVSTDIRLEAAIFRDLTGLTAGATYNVQTMHAVAGVGNADILTRRILVEPIP